MAAAPTLTELGVTAVKGFRLHHPSSVALTTGGAVGDRDFLVVDGEPVRAHLFGDRTRRTARPSRPADRDPHRGGQELLPRPEDEAVFEETPERAPTPRWSGRGSSRSATGWLGQPE